MLAYSFLILAIAISNKVQLACITYTLCQSGAYRALQCAGLVCRSTACGCDRREHYCVFDCIHQRMYDHLPYAVLAKKIVAVSKQVLHVNTQVETTMMG